MKIVIKSDMDPINPRIDTEPFGTFYAVEASRSTIGDKQFHSHEAIEDAIMAEVDWDLPDRLDAVYAWKYLRTGSMQAADAYCGRIRDRIIAEHFFVYPVYVYQHGGIMLSLSPFSCPWDSGKVGIVFVPKKKAMEEFDEDETEAERKTHALVKAEIETYGAYLNGDVYGYTIYDSQEEEVDSCWGFYGSDPEKNGMAEHWPENWKKTHRVEYDHGYVINDPS